MKTLLAHTATTNLKILDYRTQGARVLLLDVGEAMPGFNDLAAEALGFRGEAVATLCGFLIGCEFDPVEAVLPESLEPELDGA